MKTKVMTTYVLLQLRPDMEDLKYMAYKEENLMLSQD